MKRMVKAGAVALLLLAASLAMAWAECSYILWWKVVSLRGTPPYGVEESSWSTGQAFASLRECQRKASELGYYENQLGQLVKKLTDRAHHQAVCLPDTVRPE